MEENVWIKIKGFWLEEAVDKDKEKTGEQKNKKKVVL